MIRFSGPRGSPTRFRSGRGARLRARAVGQSDDREAGEAESMGLDLDAPRLEADERVGDGAREHSSDARQRLRQMANASATTS